MLYVGRLAIRITTCACAVGALNKSLGLGRYNTSQGEYKSWQYIITKLPGLFFFEKPPWLHKKTRATRNESSCIAKNLVGQARSYRCRTWSTTWRRSCHTRIAMIPKQKNNIKAQSPSSHMRLTQMGNRLGLVPCNCSCVAPNEELLCT